MRRVPDHHRRIREWPLLAWLSLVVACSGLDSIQEQTSARAVAVALHRVAAERELWPGYDPRTIPLAIYDGTDTRLFGHANKPAGFVDVPDGALGELRYDGRHPSVIANTSADLGGQTVATVMMTGRSALKDAVGTAAHEAFHVYQRREFPAWQADESQVFLYPFDDAALLAQRRLESEALTRALASPDANRAACWSRVALAHREKRFQELGPSLAKYERQSELNEGIATYVELRARSELIPIFPTNGFAPEAIRERVYISGAALAVLLDRFSPQWTATITNDSPSLDEQLRAALSEQRSTGTCLLPPARVAQIDAAARADASELSTRLQARESAFAETTGWRVTIEANDSMPLWPQGFDPLNVVKVSAGVLHHRFVSLANQHGAVEMIEGEGMNLTALTESIGDHPLFTGIRRATFVGMGPPSVQEQGSKVTVSAEGLEVSFAPATLAQRDQHVTITLGAAPK